MKYKFFKLSRNLKWSKSHMALRTEVSHCMSAHFLLWCSRVFCRWRYNVFNLPLDLTNLWSRSCENKQCEERDTIFLICHASIRENMFKVLSEFIRGNLHRQSPPCHIWWPLVYCKWRYKVFNVSSDLTKSLGWKIK